MRMTGLDGREFSFRSLAGKWVMVSASPADCTEPCQAALLQMRQQRLMTNVEEMRAQPERQQIIVVKSRFAGGPAEADRQV